MVYEHAPLSPLAEVPTPPVPAFAQATRDSRERERGSDRSGSSRRITTSVQVSTPRDSGSESPPKPLPSLPALPSVQGHQSHQSHQSIPALPPSIQRAQYPGSLKMPTSPHIPPSSSYNTSGRPGQGPAVHQLHQGQMATSPLIDAGSQGHGHGYSQSHTNHHDEGSSMPLPGPTRPWAVDTSSGSYRSPPAPVWRMPSFRRGSGPSGGGGGGGDKNVRQSRGIDMPGGPTPDERLSRYGRLRAFSGMSMSGYGYGRPNSTLGANGTSGVNGVNGSAMGNGYHDTMMKNVSKRPLTVAERLMPTLELARVEREKCARKGDSDAPTLISADRITDTLPSEMDEHHGQYRFGCSHSPGSTHNWFVCCRNRSTGLDHNFDIWYANPYEHSIKVSDMFYRWPKHPRRLLCHPNPRLRRT
jgi:hypothetical protein